MTTQATIRLTLKGVWRARALFWLTLPLYRLGLIDRDRAHRMVRAGLGCVRLRIGRDMPWMRLVYTESDIDRQLTK